jgi:hypothetical protein
MSKVEKITPHSDGQRRTMHMKQLTAVALTARGANPEAHVTFMKSEIKPTTETEELQQNSLNPLTKGSRQDTIPMVEEQTSIAVSTDGSLAHEGELTMPDRQDADFAAMTKSLADAIAYGELTDAQKEYHAALTETEKASFIAKGSSERESILDEALKADSVEYTALDGTEYRKSAGAQLIIMAKRLDDQATEMEKHRKEAEEATYKNRVESTMENLIGDSVVKASVLRAIDGIQDESIRKSAIELVESANTALSVIGKSYGTTTSSTDTANALDDLAKAYAADNSVDITTAYNKVLETEEGQAAYNDSLNQ